MQRSNYSEIINSTHVVVVMVKSAVKIRVLITQFLKIFLLESVFSACGNVNWPGHIQPCLLQSNIELIIF